MDWLADLFNLFSGGDNEEEDIAAQDEEFTQIGDTFFKNGRVVSDKEVEIFHIENRKR